MNEGMSSKVFGVFDHFGLFVGLARRLAESGARVYYATPIDRKDAINEAIIGDGMQDLLCTDDLWQFKAQIDTWVFPDIRWAGLQNDLREQGIAVWGSQRGMDLEQDRHFFLRKLAELGLDVPAHTEIQGLSNLKAFLKDKKDIWIKLSKWRGSWETTHWRSWQEDAQKLDEWAVKFQGIKEALRFICFPKIETDLEIGADTYCVDGQWPAFMLHGIERKNKAYMSTVTAREDMPKELTMVMEALSPYLREVGYRNQWSMENRVTASENYFIDATCRGGLPSTPSFCKAKNVAEIIYHGARGEMVEVDYGFKFSSECAMELEDTSDNWGTVVLKEEVKEALFAQQCCENNGQLWFPPSGAVSGHLGWLRAVGNTPTECCERMNALADELPDGCNAAVEDLASVIREIESEHEQGIPFTDAPLPDPEIVLQES